MESKVNEGDTNFWMYVQRSDNKEDAVQIGTHKIVKERYFSHLEELGEAAWFKNLNSQVWRPTEFIYAKRCPVKNPEYVEPPTDETKQKRYAKSCQNHYEALKIEQLAAFRKAISNEIHQKMLSEAE